MQPYRAPAAFVIGLLGAGFLILSNNPLGWAVGALVLLALGTFLGAARISKLAGPSTRSWTKRYTHQATIALVLLAGIYIFTQQPLVALLAFITLLYLLVSELLPVGGSANEVRLAVEESLIALDTALIAWVVLSLVLATNTPLNVVTSCSMRPALDRGDLILLQGGLSNVHTIKTNKTFEALRITVTRAPCQINGNAALCDETLETEGQSVPISQQNDILVFVPKPRVTDLIIHRAALRIEAKGTTVYLTKGDNNQRLDQPILEPVRPEDIQGKVLFRIPLVGYLKLLLFLQFNEPEGCQLEVRML